MSVAEREAIDTATAPRPSALARFRPRGVGLRALIIGLVTAGISVWGSWIPSIWGDEATSILSAERPLPSLFRMLGHVDAVHGTYYLLLHFWVDVFGPSAFSVRVPSAIAAGIAAAGVVVLADRLAGARVGIYAGIVFAVLPRTTYMGQEARGYALSCALAVWVTILLVRLLTRDTVRRRDWVLYAIGVAACAYVFLFSLLLFIPHAILVVVYRRDLVKRWLTWFGIGLLIALPILVYGIAERSQVAFLASRTAATFNSVSYGQWFGNPTFAAIAWTASAVAIITGIVIWRRNSSDSYLAAPPAPDPTRRVPSIVLVAALWMIVPMTIILSVNWVDAIYSSRYLTFAAPSAPLLIGWLIARGRRIWVAVLALAVVLITVAPSYFAQRTVYAENNSDWSVDAAYIGAHAKPGDGILFDESARPSQKPRLAMRAYPNDFVGLKDIALDQPWYDTDNWADSTYPLEQVTDRLNGVGTVWLIEHRAVGGKADTWDISTLEQEGYTTVSEHKEYSSEILELTRPVRPPTSS